MSELTPFRFGIGPLPQPKPPKSRPQSMGQPGMGRSDMVTAPGASTAIAGSTPTGAIGVLGDSSSAPMHPAAVSAPLVNPSPAANGVVPGATAGPVQRPAGPGLNWYAANTMPASGAAPELAQAAASALAAGTNTATAPMPAPYTPTAPTTNTSTTKNALPAPIRGGRGIALSEQDKVLLLKICVECQNTLKFATKTAFWRRVSNRFENIRGGRQYSAVSCERAITKLTDARRAALKNAGGRRVLSDAQQMTLLVDQIVDLQDEVEQKAKQKEAEMLELYASISRDYYGTSTQTPARMGNQQDETRVSPSIFDHDTPQGCQNSNATSPDITDNNITTLTTIEDRNIDDPMDFESTVISELSRIRRLVAQEAAVSVATTNFLERKHELLNNQLDRLEDKFKELQKTLDQQTGILSDQNTVLKQILTMMSHGRRSPLTPGPTYQGPPPQGAPYYPPYPGPPYYPYYHGPPIQGPPPQAQNQGPPPQGPQPQATQYQKPQTEVPRPQNTQSQGSKPQESGTQSQDTQSQPTQPHSTQPPASQPPGPPPQGAQPQGPPPPQGKFAVFSGWIS